MGLGGFYSCIKYLMFAFNFLFWLLGCSILGIGIWVRVDPDFRQYVDSSDAFNYFYTSSYILIGVGVLIMIIGFLGCCGAIRESQCMLVTFFIFLLIIFALLLLAGIGLVVGDKGPWSDAVSATLDRAVAEYNNNEASKTLMDNLQRNFECCGSSMGSVDYMKHVSKPPDSCALANWSQPCDSKLFAFFHDNIIVVGGVSIAIGLVMLLGMVFSIMLCCAVRQSTRA